MLIEFFSSSYMTAWKISLLTTEKGKCYFFLWKKFVVLFYKEQNIFDKENAVLLKWNSPHKVFNCLKLPSNIF